jgi:hypothetical protein
MQSPREIPKSSRSDLNELNNASLLTLYAARVQKNCIPEAVDSQEYSQSGAQLDTTSMPFQQEHKRKTGN